jgi:mRNA interferase MazF
MHLRWTSTTTSTLANHEGDVVIIDFPFGDGTGSKVRPALVVQEDGIASISVAVVLVTSNTSLFGPSRLLVDPSTADGHGSGLRMPSVITCENIYSPHRKRILSVIGRLPTDTMAKIDDCLKAALDLH